MPWASDRSPPCPGSTMHYVRTCHVGCAGGQGVHHAASECDSPIPKGPCQCQARKWGGLCKKLISVTNFCNGFCQHFAGTNDCIGIRMLAMESHIGAAVGKLLARKREKQSPHHADARLRTARAMQDHRVLVTVLLLLSLTYYVLPLGFISHSR
eukprot:2103267-Rhodomonas_salina.3